MKPRSSTTDAPVIRDLLSYRLHVVANLLSRGAELRYRREFGVSLWEWRTIALLGATALGRKFEYGPYDLRMRWTAEPDKGQTSRVKIALFTDQDLEEFQADLPELAAYPPPQSFWGEMAAGLAARRPAVLACAPFAGGAHERP